MEGVGASNEVLLSKACRAIFSNGDAPPLAPALRAYANQRPARLLSESACLAVAYRCIAGALSMLFNTLCATPDVVHCHSHLSP